MACVAGTLLDHEVKCWKQRSLLHSDPI